MSSKKLKPVWFIDIDGNINAVDHLGNHHYKRYSKWDTVVVNGYTITFAKDVIDFINSMSDLVDIRWLTTWKADAATMLAPAVGLKDFPHDDSVGTWNASGSWSGMNYLKEGRWWKQNVIMDHIENSGAPFIWTDDDISSEVRKYVRGIARDDDVDNCIVTPHVTLGLEPAHLLRIESFITEHI